MDGVGQPDVRGPSAARCTGVLDRDRQLLGEQWITARFVGNSLRHLVGQLGNLELVRRQLHSLAMRQARRPHHQSLHTVLGGNAGQRGFVTTGRDRQDRLDLAHRFAEQRERCRVEPLRVVEDQQQRSLTGGPA